MAYRLIALDLDGTLLDSHAQIRPETLKVLQQARQQGIEVIVVTGRHHIAAYPYHHQLQLSTPAICCNGTYAYDYHARRAVAANPLSKAQMLRILEKPARTISTGWSTSTKRCATRWPMCTLSACGPGPIRCPAMCGHRSCR